MSFRRIAAYGQDPARIAAFMPHFSNDQRAAQPPATEKAASDYGAEYWAAFKLLLQKDPGIAATVQGWLSEKRRIVGVLMASARWRQRSSRILSTSSRSLLLQRPRITRLYVFVRPKAAGRGCSVPAYLARRQRVHLVCSQAPQPWEMLLRRELRPTTLILIGGARRHGVNVVRELLKAFHLWGAAAVASRAALGPEPWPLLDWGFLFQRSFLDSRVLQELHACSEHPGALVAHILAKGVAAKVLDSTLGSAGGARRLNPSFKSCRGSLPPKNELPFALAPKRSILFVLLPGKFTTRQLEFVVRLVALQSRLPDEVVVAAADKVLATLAEGPGDGHDGLVRGMMEIEMSGQMAGSMTVLAPGRRLSMSLGQLLNSTPGKVGCVLRYQPPSEPERSFLLSAISCGDGPSCSSQFLLHHAFAREMEPATALHFSSAERLVNEKLMEVNEGCITPCGTSFDQTRWCGCGQRSPNKDGTLYDMAIRRASGYFLQQGS